MSFPTMPLPRQLVPKMALVRRQFPDDHIADVRAETRGRLLAAGFRAAPGQRIGMTAGSRDMGGFVELLRGIADAIRSFGAEPILLPSMGSHGRATVEGQTEVLRLLGVTEESIGAPMLATMATIELGESATGAMAHLDEAASHLDGLIVLGWTKAHPESTEGIASGLLKMTAVGLGNQPGARQIHIHGLWESVRAVPQVTLAQAKILFGVAVVENAYRRPVIIEVVPATFEAFLEADQRLLRESHRYFATLPFDHLDVLVIDRFGKNIAGTGMHPSVVGRWRFGAGGERKPDIRRIVPLSLTPESLGNGIGIGCADFTTQRFANAYDSWATYINVVTASEPGGMNTREGPLPLALPSDRDAIEVALASSLGGSGARVCRIESTAHLEQFWVSESLLGELQGRRDFEVVASLSDMAFDQKGDLI
ncbi:MAG: DUF2088 domain-containing protein [Fimbriimonas sp.]